MSMPPPGTPNDPHNPPGGAVPPSYSPPGGPPSGGYPPPDGGYPPPGGGYGSPPGGYSPPPSGGYAPPGGSYPPPGGGYPGPGGFSSPGGYSGYSTTPGPLAEWPQRALGGLIDYVGPVIVIGFIFAATRNWGIYFLLWLLSLVWGGYNAFLNGTTGQSIGKKVVGLKVVGINTGQTIGAGMGIVRWLIPMVGSAIPCLGTIFIIVDLLFPLWDSQKQTLHDKAVSSVVITVPK